MRTVKVILLRDTPPPPDPIYHIYFEHTFHIQNRFMDRPMEFFVSNITKKIPQDLPVYIHDGLFCDRRLCQRSPKKNAARSLPRSLNDSEALFIINYHYIPGSSLSVKGPFVSLPYFIIFSLSNAKGFVPRMEIRSTYVRSISSTGQIDEG